MAIADPITPVPIQPVRIFTLIRSSPYGFFRVCASPPFFAIYCHNPQQPAYAEIATIRIHGGFCKDNVVRRFASWSLGGIMLRHTPGNVPGCEANFEHAWKIGIRIGVNLLASLQNQRELALAEKQGGEKSSAQEGG